jgi:hypothetical protein
VEGVGEAVSTQQLEPHLFYQVYLSASFWAVGRSVRLRNDVWLSFCSPQHW